ncbi:MAG TPA: hypothetical protein VJ323_03960 [Bryobacteraceae bacterium]|jgi:hypothetical protein|nr:hypothetical protein [Bryobacteraceae bacterium]
MTEDNRELDELFRRYRAACPDVEPGPNFMPCIWERIERNRSFSLVFDKLARLLVTASAAACLLLAALNFVPRQSAASETTRFASYADVLTAADLTIEHGLDAGSSRPRAMLPATYSH